MLRENQSNEKNSPLRDKSFNLALRVVKLYQYLTNDKKEYVLSKQVLRSGTNPGAMVHECFNAESSLDFIHKLSIALKETGETQYWLALLYYSDYLNELEYQSILKDTVEVGKMLTASIKTKKRNLTVKTISSVIVLSTILYFIL